MARILIIDDQADLREVLRLMLEESGYEVEEAGNGLHGTYLFRKKHFDLVITDLIMPEQDGLETLKALRTLDPNVKAIAMSGAGNFMVKTNLETMHNHGANLTLTKPFDQGEFLRAVEHVLGETLPTTGAGV